MTRKLFLLAAAVIVIAACNKKNDSIEVPSFYEYEISAVSANLDTKVTYAGDVTFAWSEGDQISVLFHKGSDNKFFTFTTKTVSGASATFAGMVESGYEIGASDTGTKWALFPASEHTYSASFPTFHMSDTFDYSATHFSALVPMFAQSEDGANFAFQRMAGTYKFSFTGIKTSKVKFVVENQNTHQLSGDIPIKQSNSDIYMDQGWSGDGDAKRKLTFIENVSDGDAVFYVPFRAWESAFKPIITLYDAVSEDVLYTKTAKTNFSGYSATMSRVIAVPEITVGDAIPWSYESAFGVDWAASNVASAAGAPGINSIKGVADATNIYFLLAINKEALVMNPAHHRDNSVNVYCNGVSRYFGYLVKDGVPELNDNSGYVTGKSVIEHKGVLYYEWQINRASAAGKTELAPLAEKNPVEIRFCIFPNNSTEGQDWNTYMYAPGDGALTVALP